MGAAWQQPWQPPPVVVQGIAVEQPAVPAPMPVAVAVTSGPPLRDLCNLFIRELNLPAGRPLGQTIDAACEQLGVEGEAGRSLMDRANRCYALLGSPPL